MTTVGEIEKPIPEDNMSQYLQEIRRYPRLTVEQERELARRCAEGDQDAVREMVNANLRLVVAVAREYAGRGVPLLDLIQEGSIGLLVAARKFDYTLDYRFSTYATKWIRQCVTRCLMSHKDVIRVPQYTAERMYKLRSARAAMLQENGTEPTAQMLAQRTGLPVEKVQQCLQAMPQVCSLDAPSGEDGDSSLGELLTNIQASQPQEELVRQELKATMDRLLGMLTPRQRQVIQLHYGMEDGISHSLESIGMQLGVSKERVRQIERQAMDRLQKLGADLGLEDFLNE